MAKIAKLNVQHSYMTAKIEWEKSVRVNMTSSYSGTKITAAGVDNPLLKRLFKAFNHIIDKQVGQVDHLKNFGDAMEWVRKMGEASASPEQLTVALEATVAAFVPKPKSEGEKIAESRAKLADDLVFGVTPVAATDLIIEEVPIPAKGSGREYTQAELQAAFDRVKNAKNWKARIDRTIDVKDLDVTLQAIVHFTGTVAQEYSHPNPNKVIVRAKGYSAGGFD